VLSLGSVMSPSWPNSRSSAPDSTALLAARQAWAL
jgi:hypothetical protein